MISTVIQPAASLVKLAHSLIKGCANPGDTVIDATVGNGYDTLFLLNLVAPAGRVYGLDIQPAALQAANQRLQLHPHAQCAELILASHARMRFHIPPERQGEIKVIMFNLGYLPGGDKTLITQSESTLDALAGAIGLLAPGGVLSVMAYPGHSGGLEESEQVENWCKTIDPVKFKVWLYLNRPDNSAAPRLFIVGRTG